jgi:HSP20 family protein
MLSRLTDFNDSFDLLDELRRQMDSVWGDWGSARAPAPARSFAAAGFPRLNLFDTGAELVVEADVPGMTDKDFEITLHDGLLTLAGERKVLAPEGFAPRRQERAGYKFSRSVALPTKVDPEKTIATVKDGVLTITLAKAPEARPRQIAVKA